MRGINPFTPELQGMEESIGKKLALSTFESYLESVIQGKNMVFGLSGVKGVGKTFLLNKFLDSARRNKCKSVKLRAIKNESVQKLFTRLLMEICNAYIEECVLRGKDIKIMEMERIKRKIKENPKNRIANIKMIVDEIRYEYVALAFFIDNVENVKNERELFSIIHSIIKEKLGLPFLIALSGTHLDIRISREEIIVIGLSPWAEEEVRMLIEKLLKDKGVTMAEQCFKSVSRDGGGDPRILLLMCWTLFDKLKENEKVITKGHYLAYYQSILRTLGTRFFDYILEDVSENEKKILNSLSQKEERSISEIARDCGMKLNVATGLIIRLLKKGIVLKKQRGIYSVFNPLFGKYVAEEF